MAATSGLRANADRVDPREEAAKEQRQLLAEWGYQTPIPRHLRFEMDESVRKNGFDYFWAATKVAGMPNPRLGEYWRAGWRPVRAGDYPSISGLNLQVDQRMKELGFMHIPEPNEPIVDGDLILCLRPKLLSEQSRKDDRYQADRALYDRTEALRQQSFRAIGDKTRISRTFSRGVPPDQIPDTEA